MSKEEEVKKENEERKQRKKTKKVNEESKKNGRISAVKLSDRILWEKNTEGFSSTRRLRPRILHRMPYHRHPYVPLCVYPVYLECGLSFPNPYS